MNEYYSIEEIDGQFYLVNIDNILISYLITQKLFETYVIKDFKKSHQINVDFSIVKQGENWAATTPYQPEI